MANELSLGEILNYKGNAEQAFGNGNFAPNLTLNAETQTSLKDFGDYIIKKKETDFKTWHDNTVNAIAKAQNTEGVLPEDMPYVNEQRNKLIADIINNPQSMTSDAIVKNPDLAISIQSKIGDYASAVDMSKSMNVLAKEYLKKVNTDNDMNNEVNNRQYEIFRKTPIQDRDASQLTPIASGNKDWQLFKNTYWKKAVNSTLQYAENPSDKGTWIETEIGNYDKKEFEAGYRMSKGEYDTRDYLTSPKLQQMWDDKGGVDAYISANADAEFQQGQKLVSKAKVVTNKEYEYIQKTNIEKLKGQNRIDVAIINAESRNFAVMYKASHTNENEFPEIAAATQRLKEIEDDLDSKESQYTVPKGAEILGFPRNGKISVSGNFRDAETLKKEFRSSKIVISDDGYGHVKEMFPNNIMKFVDENGKATYYPAYVGEIEDGEGKVKYILKADKERPYTKAGLVHAAVSSESEISKWEKRYGTNWDNVNNEESTQAQQEQTPKDYNDKSTWDKRADGTKKGNGYFGVLKMKDGSNKEATEIAIGVEINGKETEIPTLVPTLSESEKQWLLKGNDPNDRSAIGEAIAKKAIDHARKRITEGKSPFADETTTQKSPTPKNKKSTKKNPYTGMFNPDGSLKTQ